MIGGRSDSVLVCTCGGENQHHPRQKSRPPYLHDLSPPVHQSDGHGRALPSHNTDARARNEILEFSSRHALAVQNEIPSSTPPVLPTKSGATVTAAVSILTGTVGGANLGNISGP